MGRASEKIVGIVTPFLAKREGEMTTGLQTRLIAIGKGLDASTMTADQSMKSIDKVCKRILQREDLKEIAKKLEKLRH